jgi:hypothetical protein
MKLVKFTYFLFFSLGFFWITHSIKSQDTEVCSENVVNAIATATNNCGNFSRNYACYGNPAIAPTPAPGVTHLNFDSVGDTEVITDFGGMWLSHGGISFMKLTMNDGATADVVVFGNINLAPIDANNISITELDAIVNENLDVHLEASATSEIFDTLIKDTEISVIVRDGSNQWVGFIHDNMLVWVSSDPSYLTIVGEISSLPVGNPWIEWSPMQAFTFESTGDEVSSCTDVAESGIIIQTPPGQEKIRFSINDAIIDIGSTVLLERDATYMYVTVLEGQAHIRAASISVNLPAGVSVRVPVNPLGTPEFIPYRGTLWLSLADVLDIPVADVYGLPIIVDMPYATHPGDGEDNPLPYDIVFYSPNGAEIDTVRLNVESVIHIVTPPSRQDSEDFRDRDVIEFDSDGTLRFEHFCTITNVTRRYIFIYSVELIDANQQHSEPFPWVMVCDNT